MYRTLLISVLFVLSGVLGFFCQMLFARTFGSEAQMDLYFTILSIPSIITGITPTIFTSLFIPELASLNENQIGIYIENIKKTIVFVSFFLSLFGCVVMLLFLDNIFNVEQYGLRETGIVLCITLWVNTFFSIINGFLSCIQNYYKRYYIVATVPLLTYIFNILFVILVGKHIGVIAIGYSMALAAMTQFLLYLLLSRRIYVLNCCDDSFNISKKNLLTKVVLISISLLPFTCFGTISYQWASLLQEGAVCYLGYSHSFSGFISVATSMGLATTTFPEIAKSFQSKDQKIIEGTIIQFERTIYIVLIFNSVIGSFFIANVYDILEFLFKGRMFTEQDVMDLSSVLPFYIVGGILISTLNLCRNIFYSTKQLGSLSIITGLSTLSFLILSKYLGSSVSFKSIGEVENTILLVILFAVLIFFRNKYKCFNLSFYFKSVIIICLTISMAQFVRFCVNICCIQNTIICIFINGIIYIILIYPILIYIFKIKEFKIIK